MSLFLQQLTTPPRKYDPRPMGIGRFPGVYIRPQVLEWTNNLSSDMINQLRKLAQH